MRYENSNTRAAACQVVSIAEHTEKRRGYDLEDGYTRIANQVLEDIISAPITDRQRRVLLTVVRLTYGFNCKSARITVSQLARITSMPRQHCSAALNDLIGMNIVSRQGERGNVAYNKYQDTWRTAGRRMKNANKAAKVRCNRFSDTGAECHQNGVTECHQNGHTIKTKDKVNASTDVDASSTAAIATRKKTDCPYQKLLELYQQHFPAKQQPRTLGDRRKRIIKQGWMYAMRLTHSETGLPLYTDTESGIEWWDRFMAWIVRKAEFCMKQQHNFSIDWLFTAKAIEGLIDGKYNTVKG
jgi:phage replication O-like protein O